MRSSARRRRGLVLAGALGLGACALDAVSLPIRPSVVVVHGLLSTATTTQVVLVERTLTGEVSVTRYWSAGQDFPLNAVSSLEPIVSDGGNPVRSATVELERPDGTILVAPEVSSFHPLGNGAGVYQFTLPGSTLVPGGVYRLRVTTAAGELVTGETTVPVVAGAPVPPAATPFDRDRDTLRLDWAPVGSARAYEVRIESPYGAWVAITDSTHITLTGSLRNGATDHLARVMIPGFRQPVTVSAVDANLYEYYRTVSDNEIGSGIENRMVGGIGVFGSLAPLLRRSFDLTAGIELPIEGRFDLLPNQYGEMYGGAAAATSVTVYMESPRAAAGQPDAMSASYVRPGTFPGAAVGTWFRDTLRLRFLRMQTLADTLETFTGTLRGDTLVGTFSKGAPARFVRVVP